VVQRIFAIILITEKATSPLPNLYRYIVLSNIQKVTMPS